MADKKISQLTAVTNVTGSNELVIVQDNTTKKITQTKVQQFTHLDITLTSGSFSNLFDSTYDDVGLVFIYNGDNIAGSPADNYAMRTIILPDAGNGNEGRNFYLAFDGPSFETAQNSNVGSQRITIEASGSQEIFGWYPGEELPCISAPYDVRQYWSDGTQWIPLLRKTSVS